MFLMLTTFCAILTWGALCFVLGRLFTIHSASAAQAIDRKLGLILEQLAALNCKETLMALSLDALAAAVAADVTVDQSAITLLNGLTAKIQELITASGNTVDPVLLQAIVDQINASKDSLAAAVVQNTPAATPPV